MKRFFLYPSRQVRLIMAILSVGILTTATLMGYLVYKVSALVTSLAQSQPEVAELVQNSISPVLDVMYFCQIFLWLSCLIVGVLVSHRIYGPIVPIVRHIGNLGKGDFSSRVRLRQGDELEEIASALNELAEKLAQKP